MTVYLIISGVLFLFFSIICKPEDLLNAVLKVALICMAVWSAYLLFAQIMPGEVMLRNGMRLY